MLIRKYFGEEWSESPIFALLYKTMIKDVCRLLRIKDNSNSNEFEVTVWDGYNPEPLESTSFN